MTKVTYIDRRKCHRAVPMRVLALGASRTGTESMRHALTQLGYNETYHGFACSFENPLDNEMWLPAVRAKFLGQGKPFTRSDWDQLLGHCQAVTDAPAMCFAPELIAAYPDAKVILTLRDVDEWYESVLAAAYTPYYHPLASFFALLSTLTRSPFRLNRPLWDIVWQHFYRGFTPDEVGKDVFREHYDLVRRLVPKERLLEYRVQEGWEPLCRFLGETVPKGAFPMTNGKKELAERIETFQRVELRWIGVRLGGFIAVCMVIRYLFLRF